MNLLTTPAIALQAAWMLLASIGAFYEFALVIAGAAWNGVNLAVCCYLIVGLCGFIGLLIGLFSIGSHKFIFSRISTVSGMCIVCLCLFSIYGYVRAQPDQRAAMNSWDNSFFGIHGPTIAFDAFAFLTCSVQVLLSAIKTRKLQSTR